MEDSEKDLKKRGPPLEESTEVSVLSGSDERVFDTEKNRLFPLSLFFYNKISSPNSYLLFHLELQKAKTCTFSHSPILLH